MKKSIFLFAIFIVLFSNCTNKPKVVTIFANSDFIENNTVLIDDTIKLEPYYITDNMLIDFKIKTGKHTLTINDSIKKEFILESDSGILNVAQEDFVIFPIEYATNDMYASLSTTIRCPVILDSLIIYDSFLAKDQTELLSKFNDPFYKEMLSKNKSKISKDVLFIHKTWDYGIDEKVPDEISVKDDGMFFKTAYKSKITFANQFLLYAKISEDYKVEKIENNELKQLVINIQNKKKLPTQK